MKKITLLLISLITSFIFAQDELIINFSSTGGALPTLQRDTDITTNFDPEGFGLATSSTSTDLILTISNIKLNPSGQFTFFLPFRQGEVAIGTAASGGIGGNVSTITVNEANTTDAGDGTRTFEQDIVNLLIYDNRAELTTGRINVSLNSFDLGGGTTNTNANNTSRANFDLITNTDNVVLSVSEFTKGDISSLVTSQNPVESSIDLNANGDYSIINILGQNVQSGSFDGSVNVESLTSGIYFLAIEGGVYRFVKK